MGRGGKLWKNWHELNDGVDFMHIAVVHAYVRVFFSIFCLL